MNVAELKKLVDKTTSGERLFLEHYLTHLRRIDDPAYGREIAQRQKDMDAGRKMPWKKVKKLHRGMLKQGL